MFSVARHARPLPRVSKEGRMKSTKVAEMESYENYAKGEWNQHGGRNGKLSKRCLRANEVNRVAEMKNYQTFK